ncbi:unnamed protein product [Calicophoron daubneyi]|uniref:Uncharacterized protein n=1 Tax=Calicophoron daubneyi TaxID=300641 RepID=A0AAV2TA22_CALDB
MAEFQQYSKTDELKLEMRKESDEVYKLLKERLHTNDSELLDNFDRSEIEKLIDLEPPVEEKKTKLLEKLECLAVDNVHLRDKTTILRYEVELLKDKLEDTQRCLQTSKLQEQSMREELSFLRYHTKAQADEIKALHETVKRLMEGIQNGDLIGRPDTISLDLESTPSNKSEQSPQQGEERKTVINHASPTPNSSTTSLKENRQSNWESPTSSWIQSVQNTFRRVKRDLWSYDAKESRMTPN